MFCTCLCNGHFQSYSVELQIPVGTYHGTDKNTLGFSVYNVNKEKRKKEKL